MMRHIEKNSGMGPNGPLPEQERRKEPRFPIRKEASVVLKGGISLGAVATEISANGIRMESGRALSPDTQVVVFIELGREARIRGTVRWAEQVQTGDGWRYRIGVRIKAVLTSEEKALDEQERRLLVQNLVESCGKKR